MIAAMAVVVAALIVLLTILHQQAATEEDPVATKIYADGEFTAEVLAEGLKPSDSTFGAIYDNAINKVKGAEKAENSVVQTTQGQGTTISFPEGGWFQLTGGTASITQIEGTVIDLSEGGVVEQGSVIQGHRYLVCGASNATVSVQRLSSFIEAGNPGIVAGGSLFADMTTIDWSYDYVTDVVGMGIMTSASEGMFNPQGEVSKIAAIAITAMIHQLLNDGEITLTASTGDQWYQDYLNYVWTVGLLNGTGEYFTEEHYYDAINRAEFAFLMCRAAPGSSLEKIKNISDGAYQDVTSDTLCATEIYKLCRAGIMSGSSDGMFYPMNAMTRAEAAAVIDCMVNPELRN